MNREIIERLAIDSSAGELNEDVEALFRAYLEEHPEANPGSEEMAQIYEDAAAAIGAKTRRAKAREPILKAERLVPLSWRAFGRWAAVLIVGALIGFTGGRFQMGGERSKVAFKQPGQPVEQVKTISDLKEEYTGTFWGDKALALIEQRPVRGVKADSRDEGFWRKYRPNRKEISYD